MSKATSPQSLREYFPRGLKQPAGGFRFALDSLLLPCFSGWGPGERIIDLGTGCGVASLGLLVLHPEAEFRITGLDISGELLDCSRQNSRRLGFEHQFTPCLLDLRSIKTSQAFAPESFDRVLCNPPYRSLSQGRQSPDPSKNQARFETAGTLEDFLTAGAYLLKNKGQMSLVYLTESLNPLLLKLSACRLEPKRLRFVQARAASRSRIVLLQAVKNANPGLIVDPPLVLYSESKERNILRLEATVFCPFLASHAGPAAGRAAMPWHNSQQEQPMNHIVKELGLSTVGKVYHNLPTPILYEEILNRNEGRMAHLGPLVVKTGKYTGRSPHDKFIVEEDSSADQIWWGPENKQFSADNFDRLHIRLLSYLQGKDIFIQDCYAGADKEYQVPLRIITEDAWPNLFARNMFIQITDPNTLQAHHPELTMIHAPRFQALPDMDHTNSEAFILINFGSRLILIGGTSYAGEIKKAVFTAMNYLMPQKNILGMHCSANIGEHGDTALYFGLSGTGKTTLSTVTDRRLIGDDEHGWDEKGIFNFEGGCYAKVIRLSKEAEPEIYECTRKFGTILENVSLDPKTRHLDLDDDSLTENTRAAYPLAHIPNTIRKGTGSHPENIFMLAADAFGVLPPISKLTPEQAMYYFISGYTAKLAGTERGVTEPQATFSTCFGAPFMALHPHVYADLLGEKIKKHAVNCWLVNTGWSGGAFGIGQRMPIQYTRSLLRAALKGSLNKVEYDQDPFFGLYIPKKCPGVPDEILHPRNTWLDKGAYDLKARELASLFKDNFTHFQDQVDAAISAAGPQL
ncbi:MAG: phosphoenolpyruvate carboxykinase (ATP) [Desulfohalobiaceae bacterium]|nr:phosphoenolpyruvate carboxykinase (ATP) [Desulfohalobiaceae bacterium]